MKSLDGCLAIWFLLVFAGALLFSVFVALPLEMGESTASGQVCDTYIKRSGDSEHFYAALCMNGQTEVFENRDALLKGKFNSADVQQQLIAASTKEVCVVTNGVRFQPMSWFRNILRVVPCR